jgi:hypothetical protein
MKELWDATTKNILGCAEQDNGCENPTGKIWKTQSAFLQHCGGARKVC